jgi:sulfatase modifying factor 1
MRPARRSSLVRPTRRRHRFASLFGVLGIVGIASSVSAAYQASTSEPQCCAQAPARAGLAKDTVAIEPLLEDPPATEMALVPGGTFWMGSDDARMPDARPWHQVTLDAFWMDRTEVTNAQFARFVDATGYVTAAERPLDPSKYPGAPAEALRAAGIVFTSPAHTVNLQEPLAWWRLVPGATFRHPEGPASSINGRENHPVVHVSWDDAVAYAKWAKKRLPTEAEWEMAARGGLEKKPFVWGDELRPNGRWAANVWQGDFPTKNTREDGYETTAPVGSFPPNAYGLSDMAGNVWEWTADWYRPDFYRRSPERSPRGPEEGFDPVEPSIPKRVTRGGSFLCADDVCRRYQPGGRGKAAPDSGTSHTGFRCVRSAAKPLSPQAERNVER